MALGVETLHRVPANEVWILGQPPVQNYLRFVRDMVTDAPETKFLYSDWCRAREYYDTLAISEAGLPDTAAQRPLDPSCVALVEGVAADQRFLQTFSIVETQFAMVELEKLVIFQHHLSRSFADAAAAGLGSAPDPISLVRFCLPEKEPERPVDSRRHGARRFIFSSEARDFRFLQTKTLRPGQVDGDPFSGVVGAVLGIAVGFSQNYFSVIKCGDRLLLENGYHRAYALRKLGIVYAPAVIQLVGSPEEFDLIAPEAAANFFDYYFRHPRPPMLKDFFDPRLLKYHLTRNIRQMVEVSLEIREFEIAD